MFNTNNFWSNKDKLYSDKFRGTTIYCWNFIKVFFEGRR